MPDLSLASLQNMPTWDQYKDFALKIQADNNAWSAQQAQKQMNFQATMSDTAHQREVADLKRAGLNPVLAAGGSGASAPSGAAGQTDTSVLQSITSYLMQQNQNLVNLESQRVSAQTALETAQIHAQAQLAAAATAAAASRYASDQNYALQIELASKYPNNPWSTLSAVLNGDQYDGKNIVGKAKDLIKGLTGAASGSGRGGSSSNSNISKITKFFDNMYSTNTYIKQLKNGGSITSQAMLNSIMAHMRNSTHYFNGKTFLFYNKPFSRMDFLEKAVYSYLKAHQSGAGRR